MQSNLYIYSGLGNIIAIIDSIRDDILVESKDVVNLNLNQNVNFDQLIVVLPPENHENDFDVKIYNNDGSIALNCINGARCVAKFIEDQSLSALKKLKVNTDGGIWHLEALSEDKFSASFSFSNDIKNISFGEGGQIIELDCISLGNPHAVTFQDQDSKLDFLRIGEDLQGSEKFPDGVNFGLASKVSENEIDLRVYERGAGETLACGSGACAAAVIAISKKEMRTPVKVNFQLGSLLIDYKKESNLINSKGSASFVEQREITI